MIESQVCPPGIASEKELVAALQQGDEAAFMWLVDRYQAAMLRIAAFSVGEGDLAGEATQETWLAVLQGIDRFEGRSSLKTWIFSILTNRARTRGKREARSISFSELSAPEGSPGESAVQATRFNPANQQRPAGHWAEHLQPWELSPEEYALSREVQSVIRKAIAGLPAGQQAVIQARDIDGLTSEEVCNVFELSDTNQRVLLHRARSRVRQALEGYFSQEIEHA